MVKDIHASAREKLPQDRAISDALARLDETLKACDPQKDNALPLEKLEQQAQTMAAHTEGA